MSKKRRKKQQESEAQLSSPVVETKPLNMDRLMIFATLAVAVIFYWYSQISNGWYQDDEVAHFLSMKGFWHDPHSALTNWAKLGYKLIFAGPALVGEWFVRILNCLVAAFSCFFAYKLTKQLGSKFGVLAFLLLATQPYWLQMGHRNYSETITAFLLILAVYLHHRKQIPWAAFILSYICIIRQEFYIFLVAYGAYLLLQKKLVPILLLGVWPLFMNFWGTIATGDWIYLYTSIVTTSAKYSGAYERLGVDHYLIMSIVVYGAVAQTLLVAYGAVKLFKKEQLDYFVFIPAALYFGIHTVFNSQTLDIGPAAGGSLRYLIVVSPFLAVMGALAVDGVRQLEKRGQLAYVMLPFLFTVFVWMSYKHNNFRYSATEDYRALGFSVAAAATLFLPLKRMVHSSLLVAGLAILFLMVTLEPYGRSPEQNTMEQLVRWYEGQVRTVQSGFTKNSRIFTNHRLFHYFQGKTRFDYPEKALGIVQEDIDLAEAGDLIIWDSHYSYRPKLNPSSLNHDYFTSRTSEYRLVKQFMSPDQRFAALMFVKL